MTIINQLENLVIEPKTLSLITTYKCTSSCKDCCFQSNPQRAEKLSVKEIKEYIKEAVEAYKSLEVLVLTGGECFIYGDKLEEIVGYASSFGLVVRVVTNGFWAKKYDKAYFKLENLKKAGLSEINFSTGDDHLAYVPIENIMNGALAAIRLNIATLINVESSLDRRFNSKYLTENEDLKKYIENGQLRVVNGIWMPFTKSTQEIMESVGIESKENGLYEAPKRCSNLFSVITIDPNHRVLACCGLTSKYIKYLDIGNASKRNVKSLYNNQFNDFLKIWLSTDGPSKILDFVSEYIDVDKSIYKKCHACQICEKLFNNPEYLDILQKNYKKVYSNIILKHLFNKKEQENYEKPKEVI